MYCHQWCTSFFFGRLIPLCSVFSYVHSDKVQYFRTPQMRDSLLKSFHWKIFDHDNVAVYREVCLESSPAFIYKIGYSIGYLDIVAMVHSYILWDRMCTTVRAKSKRTQSTSAVRVYMCRRQTNLKKIVFATLYSLFLYCDVVGARQKALCQCRENERAIVSLHHRLPTVQLSRV